MVDQSAHGTADMLIELDFQQFAWVMEGGGGREGKHRGREGGV